VRLELARTLAGTGDRAAAVTEARAALATFERLGAAGARDRAAALLREWGDPGRPRTEPVAARAADLTRREREVLDLVRAGLTNAEIAERLYISPKTAEHHVGRVLAKLGVRSRAEAAALAVRLAAEK
jgi:DNA-binding CsgD family transcriptional regulator